jgi:phosphohistidine phosphatase
MKTLYLIRHAKSSWKASGMTDFERPLNERGNQDASEMGRRLKERNDIPDLIISSEAKRALTTAKKIQAALQGDVEFMTDQRLYHSSPDTILKVINEVGVHVKSMCIVCHNPGISELNYVLTGQPIQMVTTAIAKIEFDIDSWEAAYPGCGSLVHFDYPKNTLT